MSTAFGFAWPAFSPLTALLCLVVLLLVSMLVGGVWAGRRRAAEHRAVVAALETQGRLLRALFDRAADARFVLDLGAGRPAVIGDANTAAEGMLGLPRARILGRSAAEALPGTLAQLMEEGGAHCLATAAPFQGEIVDGVGEENGGRAWELVLTPLPRPEGAGAEGGAWLLAAVRDVTEQRRRMTALADAKVQAEASARAKAEFLASLSQEIRAPMNGIVGYATFLEDLAVSDDQRHYARQLRQGCRSLLTVIDDILDLTTIEAGRIELRSETFNLHEAVDHVVSLVGAAAREKRLALRLDLAHGVPAFVIGDPVRLRQVLLNLLSNAVKFTPRGHVELAVREQGRGPAGVTLSFSVSDSGVGIPPERHERLFGEGFPVDRRASLAYGGTGLGLAVTRRLVEVMGGAIALRSTVGEGSVFTVTLTLPLPVFGEAAAPAEAPDTTVSGLYRGRILLVEDVPMNRELVGRMLTDAGHVVESVADGAAAVEAVDRGGVDLVLMDVLMPVMDGLAATRAIRAHGHTLPILALTATVLPEDVANCREAGMNDHMPKPVDREALLVAVQRWLRTGRAGADAAATGRAGADAAADGHVSPRVPASLHRLGGEVAVAGTVEQLDILLAELPLRLRSLAEAPPDWARIGRDARALLSLAGCMPGEETERAAFAAAAKALAEACEAGDRAAAALCVARCRDHAEAVLRAARGWRERLVPGGGRQTAARAE